ncbi:MAG: hypothetical protein IT537_30295 [Hyphomicrobiales bacterium]|nr:hypothetical protein [Hyphomicrobiales bacterium]
MIAAFIHLPRACRALALAMSLAAAGVPLTTAGSHAQDIVGIEDCTKTSGLDKRTGCLQSNVNFLQQLITKNAADARGRLNAAQAEIAALKSEVAALKGVVTGLQGTLAELQKAQKTAAEKDKKPASK